LLHRHKSGINFDRYSIGDRIIVTGVLGQFARGSSLDSGYEIFPRYPEDIIEIEPATQRYLIAAYIFGGALVVVLLWVVLLRKEVLRRTHQLRESRARAISCSC
jgi:hypothetical protein